jgi:tetratricopeptide (TPR) repeat protein
LGRYAEAEAAYRRAIELNPNSAPDHNNLGVALHGENKYPEAAAAFRKAIELDPNAVQPYCQLGIVLRDMGQLEAAETAYRQAVELAPKRASPLNYLGALLCDRLERPAEAEAAFRKAILLQPENLDAHFNLGIALGRQGRDADAEVTFRRAVEMDPGFANAHYWLGVALENQRRYPEALAAFRRVFELEPKHPRVPKQLARLLATCPDPSVRNPAKALEYAKLAVENAPTEVWLHSTLGIAHYRAGQWRDSVAALEQANKWRKGDDASDLIFLAMSHWQLGDRDLARKEYDEAMDWMERNGSRDDEVRGFRAEAAKLLGIPYDPTAESRPKAAEKPKAPNG